MAIEKEETTQAVEGEEAEHERLREMVNELRRRRADGEVELNHTKSNTTNDLGPALEKEIELLLQRFTVPTHNDIEELSQKISELDKKASAQKKNSTERSDQDKTAPNVDPS